MLALDRVQTHIYIYIYTYTNGHWVLSRNGGRPHFSEEIGCMAPVFRVKSEVYHILTMGAPYYGNGCHS